MSQDEALDKIGRYSRRLFFLAEKLSYPNVFLDETYEKMKKFEGTHVSEQEKARTGEFIKILHDQLVIHLFSLIEIKKELDATLEVLGKEDLVYSLRFMWEPISHMENKIRRWRNLVLAHEKFQFKKFMTLKKIDKEYYETVPKIFFVSRLAVYYIEALLINLKTEMFLEIHNELEERKKSKEFFIFKHFEENNKKIKNIVDKTKMELGKKNYDFDIDSLYDIIKKTTIE